MKVAVRTPPLYTHLNTTIISTCEQQFHNATTMHDCGSIGVLEPAVLVTCPTQC